MGLQKKYIICIIILYNPAYIKMHSRFPTIILHQCFKMTPEAYLPSCGGGQFSQNNSQGGETGRIIRPYIQVQNILQYGNEGEIVKINQLFQSKEHCKSQNLLNFECRLLILILRTRESSIFIL